MTATPEDEGSTAKITVNGVDHENGAAATWNDGENEVLVKVTNADNSGSVEYSVTVTKA